MRSEDSSSGESEEEEEAARMEICCKIHHNLLSPPLSCKHPTTVLVATYSSCTLQYIIFAWSLINCRPITVNPFGATVPSAVINPLGH